MTGRSTEATGTASTAGGASSPDRTRARPRARGTILQRARAALLGAASWLACRLPERPQHLIANLAGDAWYRVAPVRREQGRRNLRRVVRYLADAGLGGDGVTAAAHDERALERLLRSAFRHNARYYLEILRAPSLTTSVLAERVTVETPEVVESAFADGRTAMFVSGHFGPIELLGLYLAWRSGRRFVAPMETVGDPALQAWFERTRASFGVRIVGLREARRELGTSLARGESVGLVGDRDVNGGGVAVPFFGVPAALPIGPALLAGEAGVPLYVAGARRDKRIGWYRGGLIEVEVARQGTRRERIVATVAAEALAFEQIVATAPDQWLAIFFPIWPDLDVARPDPAADTRPAADAEPGAEPAR